jgi:hypothetical protein
MTDRPSFAAQVEEFKATAAERAEKRAARTPGQRVKDAVIGFGGLGMILCVIAAAVFGVGYLVWSVVASGVWRTIIVVGVAVFVLAVVARSERS